MSDFFPYRYFASEGFLPGYSFPRLPLAAYIRAPAVPAVAATTATTCSAPGSSRFASSGQARSSTTRAAATRWTGCSCRRTPRVS
ncbi:hypothetical protein NKH77_19030 [Streptomyces sp. M19]